MPPASAQRKPWAAFGLLALLFGSAFLWNKLALAEIAILGAAASYGAAAVFARRHLRGQSALAQATMVLLIADGLAWGAALGLERPLRVPALPLTWVALIALGVFGSCLAYLLYFYLIRAWDATRASTVTYLVPVVGLLLGVTVLGAPPRRRRARRRRRRHHPRARNFTRATPGGS